MSEKITGDDLIQPFQIDKGGIRGRVVRLGAALDAILARHDYPDAVAQQVGEAVVLAAMLGGALKFDGIFTVQAKGDGPIRMLVADMKTPGELRGYAGFDADVVDAAMAAHPDRAPVPLLLGSGYVAFTIDPGGDEKRYQGIVQLEGATLADCMHKYFEQSEQIATAMKVAVGRDAEGRWRAGGIMLQRMPDQSGNTFQMEEAEEAWRTGVILMSSLRDEELLSPALTAPELLYRLYHEDGVWVYDPKQLQDKCRCSPARLLEVLSAMPRAEIEHMAEDGKVSSTCQFCSSLYEFPTEVIFEKAGNTGSSPDSSKA